jgi:hypothetical protein
MPLKRPPFCTCHADSPHHQSHTPPLTHTHTHTHTHSHTRTTTGRCSILGFHHGAARLCATARQQVRHEVHCVSPSRQDAPCLLALRAHLDHTMTSMHSPRILALTKKLTRTPPTHPTHTTARIRRQRRLRTQAGTAGVPSVRKVFQVRTSLSRPTRSDPLPPQPR